MHIVRDDTAMTTVYQGNVLASSLIHRAHAEPGWFLYAPACALVGVDRARPRTAEHLTAPRASPRPISSSRTPSRPARATSPAAAGW